MHAGALDGRNPHGREVAYEQSAFRTVRAMSDIMMHGHKWDLEKSMDYCVTKVPCCSLSSPPQLLSTLDVFFKATVPG
jgi:hypothetical protein